MLKSSDELQRAALDSYAIAWRHLESREATTACTLFGRALETPILCGGMAHYDKLHEGGAVAFAEGAKAAGTSMWTGMSSDEDHEKLIAVGAPAGRIIKPFARAAARRPGQWISTMCIKRTGAAMTSSARRWNLRRAPCWRRM